MSAQADRKFGVELEYHGDDEPLAEVMQNLGLDCQIEGYNHTARRHWKIVSDGSIHQGWELVSPPLPFDASGFTAVRGACKALVAIGATVDVACGLHVHHDVSDFTARDFKRVVRNWASCQRAINQLVSHSRRQTEGPCSPTLADEVLPTFERLEDDADEGRIRDFCDSCDRFTALNVNAYPLHGTIEIRQHQGTLNAKKVLAWVEFGRAFLDAARAGVSLAYTEASELIKALTHHGLSDRTAAYLVSRAEELSRSTERYEAARRRRLRRRYAAQPTPALRRYLAMNRREAQSRFTGQSTVHGARRYQEVEVQTDAEIAETNRYRMVIDVIEDLLRERGESTEAPQESRSQRQRTDVSYCTCPICVNRRAFGAEADF